MMDFNEVNDYTVEFQRDISFTEEAAIRQLVGEWVLA